MTVKWVTIFQQLVVLAMWTEVLYSNHIATSCDYIRRPFAIVVSIKTAASCWRFRFVVLAVS